MSAKDGKNAVNGKKVENICKKLTDKEANASPTLGFPECLDATKHAQNLMDLREKRVETTEIPNSANDARRSGTDDGFKQEQTVDGYMFNEGLPKKAGKAAPTPVIDEVY